MTPLMSLSTSAVVDDFDAQFGANAGGCRCLLGWRQSFGQVRAVGVEGTGTYGAGLARDLTSHRLGVVEVDRADRKTRRTHGKSDPIDAIAAAGAVLAGTATGTPKLRTGPVEATQRGNYGGDLHAFARVHPQYYLVGGGVVVVV